MIVLSSMLMPSNWSMSASSALTQPLTAVDIPVAAASNAVAVATLRPEHLIIILGALLLSGCFFIALEVRAEYKDDS